MLFYVNTLLKTSKNSPLFFLAHPVELLIDLHYILACMSQFNGQLSSLYQEKLNKQPVDCDVQLVYSHHTSLSVFWGDFDQQNRSD